MTFSGFGARLWRVATFKSSLGASQQSLYAILRNLNFMSLLAYFLNKKKLCEPHILPYMAWAGLNPAVRLRCYCKMIMMFWLYDAGARHLPRMLQALTSVARLSFSMTLLSRPSSPLSALHIPARHPSDGLLPRYRKSSDRGGVAGLKGAEAESTSSDTDWSPPAPGAHDVAVTAGRDCRTDERPARRRYDIQLSPPRERSRSDATAYYRRHPGRARLTDHPDRLLETLLTQRGRPPV